MSIKVGVVPNDEKGIQFINELKKNARARNRWSEFTVRVRIYGRCKDKVEAFAKVGRTHRNASNANSIYSPNAPEAMYCYAWAVYLDIRKKPVRSQAYPDGEGA